jgi:GNAT superfamily N-acetyltransferase
MLFATSSLAARIDRAEHSTARAFTELAARRREDALIAPIGGTAALYSGPDQPWNKLVGLGFGEPIDEAALDAIERDFDARGAAIRVEFSTLADGAVAAMLSRRGYELIGFENVLGLALDTAGAGGERPRKSAAASGPAADEITIEHVGPAEMSAWVDVVVEAFSTPDVFDGPPPTESFPSDALRPVFRDLTAVPGFELYLARRNGQVAGGGAIRIIDRLAMLSGAATLPAHRRHGVQSKLLHTRLADAARAGCDIAVVTTEPGSRSQQNVQKIGFELLYSRAVLVRASH